MITFALRSWDDYQIILKPAYFPRCGVSTVHIKVKAGSCVSSPNKNERVLQGPGEGAGVVDIDDGQAVVFKAESHNHPTTVEPYQGAATGVGGILRTFSAWGHDQSLPLIPSISVN